MTQENHSNTISYTVIMDHVLNAFDLYEPNNRNARLKEKRSFGSQQDIYVEDLHQKIIETLCHNENAGKRGEVLINGLLDFSQAASTFIFSKDLITTIEKENVIKSYTKHILCPLLVSYIFTFQEFLDYFPSMKYLDELLMSTQEDGLAFTIRKILLKIIQAPECECYHDELAEFIRDIRPTRTQKRATILQKISIAQSTCIDFLKRESKPTQEQQNKHITPLKNLQEAYSVYIATLYFDQRTGLGSYLADQYRQYKLKNSPHTPTYVLSSVIVSSIKNKFLTQEALSKAAIAELNKLWLNATKEIPTTNDIYHQKAINTVFYFLNNPSYTSCPLIEEFHGTEFILEATTKEELRHLKPYALLLKSLFYMQNGRIEDALQNLKSNIDEIENHSIGSLPYYAATLLIGLTIKVNKQDIKNGNMNPAVRIIINHQPLYTTLCIGDGPYVGMNFDSIMSDHYSSTILRSIKKYNEIIENRFHTSKNEPCLAITNPWDEIENMLVRIDVNIATNPTESIKSIVDRTILKPERKKTLFTYIPNSTLYNCLRELNCLQSYLDISIIRHPTALKLFSEHEYRKSILQALDPIQYQTDTEKFKYSLTNAATTATSSSCSESSNNRDSISPS